MKKILVVCALFSLCCIPAFAQDAPKFEVFGGYSLAHLFQNDDLYDEWGLESMTHHGFIVAAEGNVHPNIGIVGEFGFLQDTPWSESGDGYSYEEKLRVYPILFGPRFGYRGDTVRVFGHYLLGFARTTYDWEYSEGSYSESDSASDTQFAQAIGGGVDIALSDMVSIRPVQFDFLMIKLSHEDLSESYWLNGIRYSGGIVLTFGR